MGYMTYLTKNIYILKKTQNFHDFIYEQISNFHGQHVITYKSNTLFCKVLIHHELFLLNM